MERRAFRKDNTMEKNPILLSTLSMESDIPLYSQLVSIVKRNISAGTLNTGDLLPSEAELCKTFDISRSTVRQAIGALESEGLVVRKQGRGTFVAEPKVRRKTEMVYSFTSEISSMGMTPSSTLVEFEVIEPTPDIVKVLELSSCMTYVELSNEPGYMDEFVACCFIPHTNAELFPSVVQVEEALCK